MYITDQQAKNAVRALISQEVAEKQHIVRAFADAYNRMVVGSGPATAERNGCHHARDAIAADAKAGAAPPSDNVADSQPVLWRKEGDQHGYRA